MWNAITGLLLGTMLVACSSAPDETNSAATPERAADASDPAFADASCDDGGEELRVEGIDLDGDGLDDTARLHSFADAEEADDVASDVSGNRLTVCLGNGQTHDLRTSGGWEHIEAVDLGGHSGIALVRTPWFAEPSDTPDAGREVVFVRSVDGEFGAVGLSGPANVLTGWEYHESSDFSSDMLVSRVAYGCRPSTFTRPDTAAEADFDLAVLAVEDAARQDPATPGLEVTFVLQIEAVYGLSTDFYVESPHHVRGDPLSHNELDVTQFADLTIESDLHQVLRELGFTPRCLPED